MIVATAVFHCLVLTLVDCQKVSITKTQLRVNDMESIDLRNRMKTSFGCLQMVARHEYRRLKRAQYLRPLMQEEIDFMADYQIFNHPSQLMSKEDYRRAVLNYFNIENV